MLKSLKNKFVLTTSSLVLLFYSRTSLAQQEGGGGPVDSSKLDNPIEANSISELLVAILDLVFKIGLPLVTLAIIYSGFLFVTAQGNPTKLETAKRNLLYVFVGAAIVLGAKTIQLLITGTVDNIKAGV